MTDVDCIADSIQPEVQPADKRHLTVSYATWYPDYTRRPVKIVHVPAIFMKGKWLKAAGFDTGTEVDVRVMEGCIVLTAREPKPEEPALLTSLRKVLKLSATKQQQVLDYVTMMTTKKPKKTSVWE